MEEKNNANLKEFVTKLSQLDDTRRKKVLDFMIFLTSASRKQKADYDALKLKAEQTYTGDSGKVCRFLEYAIDRLAKGDSATAIWNEYQQQEGGGNNGRK